MAYNLQLCGPAKILDSVAVTLQQVEGQSLNLGNEKVSKNAAGHVYQTYTGLVGQSPKFSLTTTELAVFLTKVGVEGLMLATGIEMYNTLMDSATGKRASGSSHEKFTIATGMILPRSIQVSQGQEAKLNFDVIGINAAGTTCPVTRTGSAALPTLAGISELFYLGPISINGTVIEGIQELTIDFGLKEVVKRHSGAPYPQYIGLQMIAPKITIKLDDAEEFNALGLQGLAQAATDSIIYLRKGASNGVRTADGTAEHIKFTINKGLWLPSENGGQHPNEIATTFEMEPLYDQTTAPIVANLASAIS